MSGALKRLQNNSKSTVVEDDKEILKSGMLRKQGGEYKSWKERWFVLTKDSLSYYKKKEDPTPIKTILVTEMFVCQKESADARLPARFPFYFSIETDARTYVISARNDAERNEWVDAIQTLVKASKKDPVAELRKELEAKQAEANDELKPTPPPKPQRDAPKGVVMTHEFAFKEYVAQLRTLVRSETLSDVMLTVGTDKFFAHRAIISARCPAMARNFPTDSKSLQPIVSLSALIPLSETLARLLDYIYTDEVDLAPSNVVDIYSAAVTFELPRLQHLAQAYIRDNVSVNNVLVLVKAANRLQTPELERFLLGYMKDVQRYTAIISQPEAVQIAEENKALYVTMSQVLAQPADKFQHELDKVVVEPSSLTKEMGQLLVTLPYSDVRIVAKDGDVFAHKVILQARCPVFMDEGMIGSEDDFRAGPGKFQVLKFPTLEANVVHIMLQALYSNTLVLEYLEDTYGLIELADRVTQENIVAVCDEMMRRNLTAATALKILMVSSEYELIPLKRETLQLIVKQAPEILKRKDLRVILSQWPWNLIDVIRALVRPDAAALSDDDEIDDTEIAGESDDDDHKPKAGGTAAKV